eukprot:9488082-Pyramimonas_sp.AAC.1
MVLVVHPPLRAKRSAANARTLPAEAPRGRGPPRKPQGGLTRPGQGLPEGPNLPRSPASVGRAWPLGA